MARTKSNINRLLTIMARLRAPGGCPWDREQTHVSIKHCAIEEAYELVDAIEDGNDTDLREELGDLLMQVIFHSQIAAEGKRFDFEAVAGALADKLVARHPHVFGDKTAKSADQVLELWHKLKEKEKGDRRPSVTDGVPRHLPGLMRAQAVQKKVSRVGFDWSEPEGVLDKIEEEIKELRYELKKKNRKQVGEELGDLLFSLVNFARFQKFNAEELLNGCTKKFINRFRQVEAALAARGKKPAEVTLEEMEAEWQKAKRSKPAKR